MPDPAALEAEPARTRRRRAAARRTVQTRRDDARRTIVVRVPASDTACPGSLQDLRKLSSVGSVGMSVAAAERRDLGERRRTTTQITGKSANAMATSATTYRHPRSRNGGCARRCDRSGRLIRTDSLRRRGPAAPRCRRTHFSLDVAHRRFSSALVRENEIAEIVRDDQEDDDRDRGREPVVGALPRRRRRSCTCS